MAVCKYCKQEMLDEHTVTCTFNAWIEYPDGKRLRAVPYNNDIGMSEAEAADHHCHDCGIKLGGMHHPGCDMERCPRCKGQLISCGCLGDLEESHERKIPAPKTENQSADYSDDTTTVRDIRDVIQRVEKHHAVGTDVNLVSLQAWLGEMQQLEEEVRLLKWRLAEIRDNVERMHEYLKAR